MSKREVPKLSRDKFPTWKSLMKLHLGGPGDYTQSYITVEHVDPTGTLTTEDMKKKKEHNQAMLEIASCTLSLCTSLNHYTQRVPWKGKLEW